MVKKKEAPKFSSLVMSGIATWKFVILAFVLFGIWATWNTQMPVKYRFDPYPFILFNLGLSFFAAIQSSIIMMNQNYQDAERDAILRRLDKHDKAIMKELKHDEQNH